MTRTDIVTRVVRAMAAADGVEPADVNPLYDYIDPEVLYMLDEQEQSEWSLTFQYSDHQITVTHESQVLIDGISYSPDSST
jgi:hypothetical protein